MIFILLLICIPILSSIILACIKNNIVRNVIISASVLILATLAVMLAVFQFNIVEKYYLVSAPWVNVVLLAVEVIVAVLIIFVSLKNKKFLIAVLTLAQTAALLWFELLSGNHSSFEMSHHMFIDKLNMIITLIVAVIGGLIVIYAISYMKNYHKHHEDVPDRRRMFFSVIFLFFSAMFGIVFSNDLTWIFLFWEITTLCSFLLIGYNRSEDAKKNAFTALLYNIIGSVFFAAGIIFLGLQFQTVELSHLILLHKHTPLVEIAALFITIGGLAKSAQMPFSKWLLGAMVAPTPTSALLHSSTMVKAGVYLILRIAPLFTGSISGFSVVLVGGITFLAASFIAITQSDAKKVLAYSTIANLGLIVACAGIGTYEAMWAALFLIIFHACAKSLMFLSVGSVENLMGSRNIEDMHGLIVKLPNMALFMTIGIAGMFLAPFGMLISKWAAMKAFIDSKNLIMLFMLVFGSAATLFYWTKWLGKLVAIRHQSERLHDTAPFAERFSLFMHSLFTVLICLTFPLISKYIIEPFLGQIYGYTQAVLGSGNEQIMLMLLGMILLLPLGLSFLTRNSKLTNVYMGGINEGDNRHFKGSGGENKRMYLANWYMERYFEEKRFFKIGTFIALGFIISIMIYLVGSIL